VAELNARVNTITNEVTKNKNNKPLILYEDDLFFPDLKIIICIFSKF
jgi:predicted Mrr-cat superfamily restriction endonuclease